VRNGQPTAWQRHVVAADIVRGGSYFWSTYFGTASAAPGSMTADMMLKPTPTLVGRLRFHPVLTLLIFVASTLVGAVLLSGGFGARPAVTGRDRYPRTCDLFDSIVARVSLMRDVAAAKAATSLALTVCIFDAAQEASMLESAASDAVLAAVPVPAATVVAQLQADCAKQEQANWIAAWAEAGSSPAPARPLAAVREELRQLTANITRSWGAALRGEWAFASCAALQANLPPLLAAAVRKRRARSGYCNGGLYLSALLTSLLNARDPPCALVTAAPFLLDPADEPGPER